MDTDDSSIIDANLEEREYSFSPKNDRIIVLFIIATALASMLLSDFAIKSLEFRNVDGALIDYSDFQRGVWKTFLFGIPMLGFTLGVIFSIIPYKKMRYVKKYFRFSIVIILTFNLLYILLLRWALLLNVL